MTIWGRSDRTVWGARPPFVPLGVLLGLALLGGVTTATFRYTQTWTPLQRHYLGAYGRSAVALSARGDYDVWQIVDRTGARLALDEDLVSVTTATGETSFALAAPAATAGTRLVLTRQPYPHAALHAFLQRWVYRDQTVLDLLAPPLWAALALVLGGAIGARAQAVVEARAWRGPSPPWSTSTSPIVVDPVDRPRRLPSPSRLALRPASTPPSASTSVPAPAAPPSSPASWPELFFK